MLRACGVEKFRVPVERVATARLKEQPEDFIVVEVDPEGGATDAPTYKLPTPQTPEKRFDGSHSGSALLPDDVEAAKARRGANVARLTETLFDEGLRQNILSVFGSKAEAVALYATCAKDGSFPVEAKEYVVGVFKERDNREQMRRALKILFPYLRSETRRCTKAEGGADAECCDYRVVVTYDNDFLLIAYLLGEPVVDALAEWGASAPPDASLHLTAEFPATASKDLRRNFHEVMSKRYPNVTCRVSSGRVTIRGPREVVGKRRRAAGDNEFVGFTHLLVRKRNLDMMELRMLLAEQYKTPVDAVCAAGMKDKCAVTYQRCSVPCTERQMLRCGEGKLTDGKVPMRLTWGGDPSSYVEVLQTSGPHPVPVGVGELRGNRFVIRLRGIHGIAPAELGLRLQRLESEGFLNYFGQQRFSEHAECLSDHVGIHILAGRWPEAVRCLLRGDPTLYSSFPARMEERYVPRNLRDARCIVHFLNRLHRTRYSELTSDDVTSCSQLWRDICHDALQAVPYAFRVLWLHSAQSLIFNCMLSKVFGSQLPATLPLLGCNVVVEEGILSVLEETLAQLDLGPVGMLTQKRKVLGVAIPGAVRATVVRPGECSVEFHADAGENSGTFDATISFFLPSSGYATTFLRELLGSDTWWRR